MKSFFTGLWQAIRKAPVAKWIRPIWQAALRHEIEREGDRLQNQLRAAVSLEGPGAVDRVFDQSQVRLKAAVLRQSWLPGSLEDRLAALIQKHGDRAQEAVKLAVIHGGPAAVDQAVDAAQELLLAQVAAL